MKKYQKAKLHEEDRFMRSASFVWSRVASVSRRLWFVLVIILLVVAALLIVRGVGEERSDAMRSTIDNAETIEEMEKVAVRYPGAWELRLRLGYAYAARRQKGDLEKAEGALDAALGHAPGPMEKALVALPLGEVRMDLGRLADALALFDRALAEAAKVKEFDPLVLSEANWYAGRCLEKLGRAAEAQTRYEKVRSSSSRGRGDLWKMLAEYRQTKTRQESTD